jgi:polyphosphate kinase
MPRNLYERVEVLFPLKDPELRERICKEILPAYLADNQKARVLGSDGKYTAVRQASGAKRFSVQEHLMKLAGGFVNGSGTPRGQAARVAYTKGEPGNVPVEPTQALELEVPDSSNATV